jgi:hypothetical protein
MPPIGFSITFCLVHAKRNSSIFTMWEVGDTEAGTIEEINLQTTEENRVSGPNLEIQASFGRFKMPISTWDSVLEP